jgi:hypothetical protein
MRSLLRMAGVSQKAPPEEVLPLIANNVFSRGYENWQLRGRPTEYLVLLQRYIRQARELSAIAGSDGVIRVANCEQGRDLLRVLGYRLRKNCGDPAASVITQDPERAFLTTDSGFPLLDLEEALQRNQPYALPYAPTPLPVLFSEGIWVAAAVKPINQNLIDVILDDPSVARLYWAMSRMDEETRNSLLQSPGLKRLVPLAPVLDFYGEQITIRSGHVLVPGGQRAQTAWADLVGVSPDHPGEFVVRLLSRDKGWLAAYFDAMSRISEEQQSHFLEVRQLKQYYGAFRAPQTGIDAARPAFRPAPGVLLLLTRLQWQSTGDPAVPGDLASWNQILRKSNSYVLHEWRKHRGQITSPQELLEAMFACSRANDFGPLEIYLALSELDSRRPATARLRPETVLLLASKFADFSQQFRIFLEFPNLGDESIVRFLNTASAIDKISDHTLRGNAMGIFQANLGLWQILARQGQIPPSRQLETFQAAMEPFATIGGSAQLFDAGTTSLRAIVAGINNGNSYSQDELIGMLAGPVQSTPEGKQVHAAVVGRLQSIMTGQRLVSLDTLRVLSDGLNRMASGAPSSEVMGQFAKELRAFEMPRPMFTSGERSQWASGIYNNHHTDIQMRTDLNKVLDGRASPGQLREARGELTPFLRDTLVGLNYAYYEPPGSQVLRNNPLFVRSHDFAGETITGDERLWQAPQLIGEGTPAGGGAHFVGSLADLPYALADVEQDFIAPENIQALIWRELVPGLLVSATLPRWWDVSNDELHAVALYQKSGEELVSSAARDPQLRGKVMRILTERLTPLSLNAVDQDLQSGAVDDALLRLTPADTFYLSVGMHDRNPWDTSDWGRAWSELGQMHQKNPSAVEWRQISHHFGVPHPVLVHNYGPELLNVKPFPTFEGYSSRLLAETWDSNNLYWARLADEMGIAPVKLNELAPELTRQMVAKIFATDLEDWGAILRAMRETGSEFRQHQQALVSTQPAGRVSAAAGEMVDASDHPAAQP